MFQIIERSVELPIPIDTIRDHCRAPENGDDDEALRNYMRSAVWFLEQQTSRVAVPTEFKEHFSDWPPNSSGICWSYAMKLGRFPVREVYGISYLDDDENLQQVAGSDFRFDRTPEGGDVAFGPDFTAPLLASNRSKPIYIHYTAGTDAFGTTEGDSGYEPDLMYNPVVGHALLLLTAHWYENREPVNIGNITSSLPFSLDALLSQLRIFR